MPIFKELLSDIHKALVKHDNRKFLEATMAACAIVANADGVISFSERGCFDQIINLVARLKIYDPHEAVDLFNEYVERLNNDEQLEKKALLKKIRDIISHKEDQELLLKICWRISRADGEIKRSEREAVEDIATNLGLNFKDIYRNF